MKTLVSVCLLMTVAAGSVDAQRRATAKKPAAPVTFAILVTDPEGAQVPSVLVTVEGPATRTTRTEGGRIALENLPAGDYRLRFEKAGFVTLERELTARGGAPIDVKVTLRPSAEAEEPAPAAATAPVAPDPSAPSTATPALIDVPAAIEREFVGRSPERRTSLACGDQGSATLIQLNDPMPPHAHDDADEFVYVVAGEGTATVGGTSQRLRAGVLLFIPRGTPHGLTRSGRNPLIVLATRAGDGCR